MVLVWPPLLLTLVVLDDGKGDDVIEKIMSARLRRRLAKVAAGEAKAGPQFRVMKTTGTGTEGLVSVESKGVNTDEAHDDDDVHVAAVQAWGRSR